MTTIYLIRHGKSKTNEAGVIGKPRAKLSAAGKKQAQELAGRFRKLSYSAIYTSKYTRTKETALPFIKNHSIKSLANFNERSFGLLEDIKGQLFLKELKQILDILPIKLRKYFKFSPRMESDHEAYIRFTKAIEHIKIRHSNESVLVFTHSNIMRIFLVYSGLSDFKSLPAGSIKNCGYVQLRSSTKGLVIQKLSI